MPKEKQNSKMEMDGWGASDRTPHQTTELQPEPSIIYHSFAEIMATISRLLLCFYLEFFLKTVHNSGP